MCNLIFLDADIPKFSSALSTCKDVVLPKPMMLYLKPANEPMNSVTDKILETRVGLAMTAGEIGTEMTQRPIISAGCGAVTGTDVGQRRVVRVKPRRKHAIPHIFIEHLPPKICTISQLPLNCKCAFDPKYATDWKLEYD